ncbi:hypothetical protein [Streptomyces sp. H34-S4]|uniref:hypothetical protein n=1 Tax=Streptomyces sp. H34-S4 TaxID=2996463 RepID=UPI0022709A9F|nr:hypothetical protein [Streptomyces sp. H34-S4]MCY0939711.1 hypothetical protein [Streptomyces sp. H34-S4]
MLERTLRKDRTEVTFILPADTPPGPVSVVGDFNDWQPGVHGRGHYPGALHLDGAGVELSSSAP